MKIKYAFVNGEHSEVEVSEEMGNLILQLDRAEKANNERYRYHNVALSSFSFEGSAFSYAEAEFTKEEDQEYRKYLFSALNTLTTIQRRRFLLFVQGMSIRKIAEIEGVNHRAICESISYSQKKLKKYLENTHQNTPLFW